MGMAIREKISVLLLFFFINNAGACVWDDLTQSFDKKNQPKLSDLLFSNKFTAYPPESLRKRLEVLENQKEEDSPQWHNNVAGIYLRLGEAEKALGVLTSAAAKFPQDYGIHANLGSAYTLLGKFEE